MKRYYMAVVFVTGLVLMTLVAASLQGCATFSADKAYLAARAQYNDEVRRYEDYYQAATPEQKAQYKKEVDPKILKAERALDLWGATMVLKNGDGTEMGAYLDAKNAMLDALFKAYGKE